MTKTLIEQIEKLQRYDYESRGYMGFKVWQSVEDGKGEYIRTDDLRAIIEQYKTEGAEPVRMFNMQNPPIPIPWHLAEALYAVYSDVYRKDQSLEKLHSRGGFGWGEISVIMKENPRTKKVLQDYLTANPLPQYYTHPSPAIVGELVKALEKLTAVCRRQFDTKRVKDGVVLHEAEALLARAKAMTE